MTLSEGNARFYVTREFLGGVLGNFMSGGPDMAPRCVYSLVDHSLVRRFEPDAQGWSDRDDHKVTIFLDGLVKLASEGET
jgi:hypothetical protein